MKRFLTAIEQCLERENWTGALFIALTLPDICGKISYPSDNVGDRYRGWFDAYLSNEYKSNFQGVETIYMSAGDCYVLRCAMLHAGSDDVSKQRQKNVLSRFVFTTFGGHRTLFPDLKILQLDVKMFCEEMIAATKVWLNDMQETADYKAAVFMRIETDTFHIAPGIRIGPKRVNRPVS